MELKYTITEEDFLRFNIRHMEHSPSFRKTLLLTRALLPLLLGVYLVVFWKPVPLWPYALFFGAWSVGWFFFAPWSMRRSLGKRVAAMLREGRDNDFIGPITLELRDDYLLETTRTRKTEYTYDSLEKIVHDGNLLYIYCGAMVALLIPDAAFSGPVEKSEFLDFLKRKSPSLAVVS